MSRFKFFEDPSQPENRLEDDIFRYGVDSGMVEYELIQEQQTVANDQLISDTKTVMQWQQEHIGVAPSGHRINLNLASHDVVKTNQLFAQLSDFAKLFNAPVARLELSLDKTGSVIGIVNQKEIYDIWNDIKAKELHSLINAQTSESESIVKAGDKDFSNTLELVTNGTIYQLMFPAIYEKSIPAEEIIRQKFYSSNIFNEKKIEFEGKRVFSTQKDDTLLIKENFIAGEAFKHSSNLKEIYDSQFKPVLNTEMNYHYSVERTYKFLKHSGLLEYATCKIEERLNQKFIFTSTYELILKK